MRSRVWAEWCANRLEEACRLTKDPWLFRGVESYQTLLLSRIAVLLDGLPDPMRTDRIYDLQGESDAHLIWVRTVAKHESNIRDALRAEFVAGHFESPLWKYVGHCVTPRHMGEHRVPAHAFDPDLFGVRCSRCGIARPALESRERQRTLCLRCHVEAHRATCGCDRWGMAEELMGL